MSCRTLSRRLRLLDKVEESKEFASRLQSSLYVLHRKMAPTKNARGEESALRGLIGPPCPRSSQKWGSSPIRVKGLC
jgi:hypothetical protein